MSKNSKKGKLSLEEKYAIQGMLNEDKTIEEIEGVLSRENSTAVRNYVKKELADLQETIIQTGDMVSAKEERAELTQKIKDSKAYSHTRNQLLRAKLNENDADRILRKAISQFDRVPDENELYRAALSHMRSGAFMGKQGRHQNEATIMTKVASERADFAKESMPNTVSRTARKAIYRPSSGEVE